jgi:hypothetical protein
VTVRELEHYLGLSHGTSHDDSEVRLPQGLCMTGSMSTIRRSHGAENG